MGRRILPATWAQPEPISAYLRKIAENEGSEDTLRAYRGTLNRLAYWLEVHHGVQLLDATEEHLREWRAAMAEAVERGTLVWYVRVVQGFYKWAHRRELLAHDPAWELPTPKLRRRKPRPIAEANLLMAIEAAPATLRLWLVLAAFAGLRCCEIATLRREDIYDTGGEPYMIVLGKGDKERTVPLSPFVWAELQWYGLPPRRGRVFYRTTKDGKKPYNANYVSKRANDYLRAMGVPDTFHACRHRFGTHGARAARSLRTAQEVMGHDDPKTTALYSEVSDPDAREMVDAIQPNPWPARLNSNICS